MVFGNPIYNWVVQSPVNPKPPGCFHCSLGIQSSWDTHRVGQPGKILSQLANGIFLLRHSGFQGANLARVFAWEQRCFWVSSVNPESWKVFKQKCLKKTRSSIKNTTNLMHSLLRVYLSWRFLKKKWNIFGAKNSDDPWKHRNPVHSCWYPTDFRLKFSSQHLLKGIIGPPLFFDLCESRRSWCTLPRTNISRPWK